MNFPSTKTAPQPCSSSHGQFSDNTTHTGTFCDSYGVSPVLLFAYIAYVSSGYYCFVLFVIINAITLGTGSFSEVVVDVALFERIISMFHITKHASIRTIIIMLDNRECHVQIKGKDYEI